MISPSDKRIIIIRHLNSRANPLASNDVPPASGDNHSTSENTQDSSAPKDETTTKSRRKRRYSDTEGNGRTAGSADRKTLASTRPGVGHDARKAESSSLSYLHPSSPSASTGITAGKNGATDKLKGKRRHSDVDGAEDISASEPRRENLQASIKPGLRSTSPRTILSMMETRVHDESKKALAVRDRFINTCLTGSETGRIELSDSAFIYNSLHKRSKQS